MTQNVLVGTAAFNNVTSHSLHTSYWNVSLTNQTSEDCIRTLTTYNSPADTVYFDIEHCH